MRTLQITRPVDDDGILRLEIPAEEIGDETEILIVIEPRRSAAHSAWLDALRKTWGSCPDLEDSSDSTG
jgi:hypothetical protein